VLVSTYKVENPTVGLLLRSEIVISSSSKGFAYPTRRNTSAAHSIPLPVLDHDDATSACREKRKESGGNQTRQRITGFWRPIKHQFKSNTTD
jgi:hypothetical protein